MEILSLLVEVCTGPEKLSDKGMAYWNLHKKNQLPSALHLRDFDFQSQAVLIDVH